MRETLLQIAAHVLEANASDLEVSDGVITVKGSPRHRMTVAELRTNQLDSEQEDRALVSLFNDLKRRQAGSAPTDG